MIDLTAQSCTGTVIATLKELLGGAQGLVAGPGAVPFVPGRAAVRRRHLPRPTGAGLLSELRVLLGTEAVRLAPLERTTWSSSRRPASPRPPGSARAHATRGHPALDVAGGRLVHVLRSGQVPATAFGADPLAAANAFVDAGATRLHLVDVDLARSGEMGNADALGAVCGLGVPVQASGGVRTGDQVGRAARPGAERVVLGSAALHDRDEAEVLVRRFGDRLVVGIEADGQTVRAAGIDLELPLRDLLVWLAGLEVRRYLVTEVGGPAGSRVRISMRSGRSLSPRRFRSSWPAASGASTTCEPSPRSTVGSRAR